MGIDALADRHRQYQEVRLAHFRNQSNRRDERATEPPCVSMRFSPDGAARMLTHGGSAAHFWVRSARGHWSIIWGCWRLETAIRRNRCIVRVAALLLKRARDSALAAAVPSASKQGPAQ